VIFHAGLYVPKPCHNIGHNDAELNNCPLILYLSSLESLRGSEKVLLEHFYEDVIDDIRSEAFIPRLEQPDIKVTDVVSDMRLWCQGFLSGMVQNHLAWQRWFEDPRRAKAIAMIAGIADQDIPQKSDAASAESLAWTAHCFIWELVPLIWTYWHFESALAELVGPEPENAGPRIGRNQPCPSGSGKKYKHCSGTIA
jgi:hypothetical protein